MWTATPGLRAQVDPNPDLGTPVALESRVAAVRGQVLEIELETITKTPASIVEFLVRDFPSAGTLGAIRTQVANRTTARVTYTPNPNSQATQDFFTYSVRYRGGIYSLPVRVTIDLSDPAPRLESSDHAWFGHIMVGTEATREILVRNRGNAGFDGILEPRAPWHIVSPPGGRLVLAPRQETLVEIAYRPTEAGSEVYTFTLQPVEGGSTLLHGQSFVPFKTLPERLALEWHSEADRRFGRVTLYSLAKQTLAIELAPDKRLQLSGSRRIALEPGAKTEFEVFLSREDVASYEGKLGLISEGYRHELPIVAETAPARLALLFPDGSPSLDFGKVPPGDSAVGEFELLNRGGRPAAPVLRLEGPFELERPPSDTPPSDAEEATPLLEPGASRRYRVRYMAPTQSSLDRGQLTVEHDDRSLTAEIRALVTLTSKVPPAPSRAGSTAAGQANPPIVANRSPIVFPPDFSPKRKDRKADDLPAPALKIANGVDDERRTPLGFITEDLVERNSSFEMPSVGKVELVKSATHHLVLGWRIPSLDATRFEVDMRQTRYNTETHAIDSVWIPWHDVSYELMPDQNVRATIQGLSPGMVYEFRIFSATSGGLYSEPSEPFGVGTLATSKSKWWHWLVLVPLIAFLGWFGLRYYRATYG